MRDYEELNLEQEESERDPFTEDRYRQFFKFMPKNVKSVLDVGCNTGRGGAILKSCNKNIKISGLDVVKTRLDRLPKGIYQDNVYGSSTKIPVKDCTYDVIVAGEFIEHLYPSDVDTTLTEMFRVLKVGGLIMLTTPNPSDWKRKLRGASILGGSHVSQHFHHALKMKLNMVGFSAVKVFGSGKVTWYLGDRFPFLSIYGSYLIIGKKY